MHLQVEFSKASRWIKPFKPVGITLVIYFVYHWVAGVDPFVKYTSLSEMYSHINTISLALRLSVIAVFFYYIIIYIRYIWAIIPLYNDYIENNISDSDCNVDWIRRLVVYISCITVMYFIMLFFSHPIVNFLYLSSLLITFIYLIEMSLFRRISERIESIRFKWDNANKTWMVDTAPSDATPESSALENTPHAPHIEQIDAWMEESKAYTHIDFTTNDIIAAFPNLTQYELSALFKLRNETFQSYVRRYRICRACEIMENEKGKVYPKQVYDRVGFSHYSSFSRSFVTVTGNTPSDYLRLPIKEQNAIIKNISEVFTPPPRNLRH